MRETGEREDCLLPKFDGFELLLLLAAAAAAAAIVSFFGISYVLLCVHSSINGSFENGSSREPGTWDAKT